jgi:hypothetical protein
METVAVLVMGMALGSVLGYWSVLLRVWRLEKELAQALLQVSVLGSELAHLEVSESEWVWVRKSEWETVKVRQSELEMALDLEKSKAMWKE